MTIGSIPDFLPGCIIDQLEQAEQGLMLCAHVNGAIATCPTYKQRSETDQLYRAALYPPVRPKYPLKMWEFEGTRLYNKLNGLPPPTAEN